MSSKNTIRIEGREFVDHSVEAIRVLMTEAIIAEDDDLLGVLGLELKIRKEVRKRTALKAVDWSALNKGGSVLPNGGRLGPKSDITVVISIVSMAQFILRGLPKGQRAFSDNEVQAIKDTLASNVLCGRSSDDENLYIKSFSVQVLDNGHLRVIGTPSPASQDDEKGMNVFSVTTTDEGPVKVERHMTTHQVPVQGSAA